MERKFEILIVDDNVALASSLGDILEVKGYNTAVTHDGQTALALCREKLFDLALIDIKLPDIPGLQLTQKLAKLSLGMEYIIITGYASLETAVEAVWRRHVVAYETKPLNMDHLLALIAQIVERKQAEERLRESEAKYSVVVEKSADGIIIVQDGALKFVNPMALELGGFTPEELTGVDFLKMVTPESRETVMKRYTARLAGKEVPNLYEIAIIRKDGTTVPVEVNATLISYQGRPADLVLVRDISERKQAEEEARQLETLRELDQLRRQLLANVSHELRTPLASIKGYATMLLDYDTRLGHDEKRECLKLIDKATVRLTKLVDNLLDMSRLEVGLLKPEKTPTSISKLLRETVADAQVRALDHRVVLKLTKRLPRANIDARRIRQVLDNLIDNATKYSRQGTQVLVSAQKVGQELLFRVADQGIGIPPEELVRIFDPMYHIGQRLTPGAEGAGLGLAICKGLVEAHGGRIWMESEEGKGSTCIFTLSLDTKGDR